MVYLPPPRDWELWLGWDWFVRPSGGHTPPWSLWTRLTEAPLPGHAVGSWGIGLAGLLVFGLMGWRLWGFIVLAQIVWQAFNVERRAYGDPPPDTTPGEILWRILIGAVAGLPVVFL